jgi:hypothetical protein
MDCPRCKLTNPDSAQRCDCGYDFGTKTVEKPYFTSGLSGIGGWLAFFILSLIVFSPILGLVNLNSEIVKTGCAVAVLIDCVISLAIMSFGVYAGTDSSIQHSRIRSSSRSTLVNATPIPNSEPE